MSNKQPVRTGKKKKIKPVYKPYLRGNAFSMLVVRRGLRMLGYALIFLVLNLFVGTIFTFENMPFLRIVANAGQLLFYGMLLYSDGLRMGDGDVAFAEIQYDHQQAGETIGKPERDRCFHPLKGLLTVLIGLLPVIVLCAVYGLQAKKNTYALQALPEWVSAFSSREEVMAPLAYYSRSVPFTVLDGLKVIVRLLLYPFYNLAGPRNDEAILLIDRLSALLVLLPFLPYAVGYVMGVRSRAMTHGGLVHARRVRKRGQNRKVQKKPARKNGGRELI